ncbi:hypothetical protein QN277_008708 [Acacia crassicarpa]|uniref:Uncharacterized protein n=1 Tax=Acacia crassicarpa TaxID=499986 RepID=A0AAE1ISH3_9FABA|nr:hypothetical protein QN277_008708 [Acacia crassicarpa]
MITDFWRRMITMLDNQYSMLTKTNTNLGIELVKVLMITPLKFCILSCPSFVLQRSLDTAHRKPEDEVDECLDQDGYHKLIFLASAQCCSKGYQVVGHFIAWTWLAWRWLSGNERQTWLWENNIQLPSMNKLWTRV